MQRRVWFNDKLVGNWMQRKLADSVIVLDFETTGLSPAYGDRAIEVGAVLVEHSADFRNNRYGDVRC